jgi:hypothetical protein
VARILNENGFKTGDALALTSTAVGNGGQNPHAVGKE